MRPLKSLFILIAALGVYLICPCPLHGDAPAATRPDGGSESEAATRPQIDSKVRDILEAMNRARREAASFTVRIESQIKISGASLKEEGKSQMKLAFQRPDKFALSLKVDTAELRLIADGKKIWEYLSPFEKYTEKEQTGPIAEAITEGGEALALTGMAGTIIMTLIMTLLSENPAEEILKDIEEARYAGRVRLGETLVEHLTFKEEDMKWELWVQADGRPLPLKMTMNFYISDTADADGDAGPMKGRKVEIQTTFDDWQVDVELPAETFTFKPPEKAQKVDSLFEGLTGGEEEEEYALLGKPAPDLELPLLGGGKMDLASHKGKNIVVLDFWATWCRPCAGALPVLAEVTGGFKDKGVVFYAVNLEEDVEEIRDFLKGRKLNVTVALDKDGKAARRFAVSVIPLTVIVDREGIIQAVHKGLTSDQKSRLTQELSDLLEGKALARASGKKPGDRPGEEDAEASTQPAEADLGSPLNEAWSVEGSFLGVAAGGEGRVWAVGNTREMIEFDADGRKVRSLSLPMTAMCLRIGNLAGDSEPEFALYQPWMSALTVIDLGGREMWTYPRGDGINDVAIADLEGDGHGEVVIGYNGSTGLHVLDHTGSLLWKNTELGNVWRVCAGDVDPEPGLEVISTSAVGRVHVFSNKGKRLADLDAGVYAHTVRYSPPGRGESAAMILVVGGGVGSATAVRLEMNREPLWKKKLTGGQSHVYSAVVAGSRPWLAVGLLNGPVRVLNTANGSIIAHGKVTGRAVDIAWLERPGIKNPLLVTASGGPLRAFEIQTSR